MTQHVSSGVHTEPAVAVRNVTKAYPLFASAGDRLRQLLHPREVTTERRVTALHGVNLQIEKGQIFGIVGRNGSGKSTLMRLLAGVVAPSDGSVACSGRVAALLELGAGFNPELSGRDNVLIGANLLGVDDETARARLPQIEAFADVGEFFERPVKTYSTGMYARVAFAAMAVCEPDILVLDEILAVGDEAFQRKCIHRLQELAGSGCTIVLVTHSSQLVLELCDAAALLHEGELIVTGAPKTVVHEYYRRQGLTDVDEPAAAVVAQAPPASAAQFDAALTSNAVHYGDGGATISAVRVQDESGATVNVLQRGAAYELRYQVHFAQAAHNVEFGSLVKNRTGVELGGLLLSAELGPNAAANEQLASVAPDSRFEVTMPFVCRLLPDTYFCNAGVRASSSAGMAYLHRVMDALAFRVLPEGALALSGIVDLSTASAPSVRAL